MPGSFTYWAVFEDCRRLARFDIDVEPLLLDVIEAEVEHARVGALVHNEDPWQTSVLVEVRGRWDGRDARLRQRLAFVLGGFVHAATHRTVGEGSAQGDARAFREAYLAGHEVEFEGFLLERGDGSPEPAANEFVLALFARALQGCHTIEPDLLYLDEWLDRLFFDMERLPLMVEESVGAVYRQDGADGAFYKADDPAVRAAGALRLGEALGAEEARAALVVGSNESAYGRALGAGVAALKEVSALWRGEAGVPAGAIDRAASR